MKISEDLEHLTKEELIERVKELEQACDAVMKDYNSLRAYCGRLISQRIEEAEDADED